MQPSMNQQTENSLIVGIDTSNYTTSLAILSADGSLLANLKRPLPVSAGERGLRQSDAVFAHIKNFPSLANEAKPYLHEREIAAIGVSTRPRLIEGSYMPCFLSGVSFASSLSLGQSAPLFEFSHQCGHIMAALYSSERIQWSERPFCAFHVSGGTTEVLRVKAAPEGDGFLTEHVGGTRDLNAGQVIDRIGVYMGLSFPCGIEMERLASLYDGKIPKHRMKVADGFVNLSGLENLACRLYDDTKDKALCAAFVLDTLADALQRLASQYLDKYGEMPIVFAGGVMSNERIRARIEASFLSAFAEPELSRDNAVGIAELTRRKLTFEK